LIRSREDGDQVGNDNNIFSVALFSKKPITKKQTRDMSDTHQKNHWSLFEEGHLMIDMYENPDAVVVRSFVAGIEPENLEISIHHDMLTIRGHRHDVEEIHDDRFFHRECYWGNFSRSVIIPKPINVDQIRALFKNGVVTIILPKQEPTEASISLE